MWAWQNGCVQHVMKYLNYMADGKHLNDNKEVLTIDFIKNI